MTDFNGVAECLSTTDRHIRKMAYERRIPFAKVDRLLRFDLNEIDTWIGEHSTPPR